MNVHCLWDSAPVLVFELRFHWFDEVAEWRYSWFVDIAVGVVETELESLLASQEPDARCPDSEPLFECTDGGLLWLYLVHGHAGLEKTGVRPGELDKGEEMRRCSRSAAIVSR